MATLSGEYKMISEHKSKAATLGVFSLANSFQIRILIPPMEWNAKNKWEFSREYQTKPQQAPAPIQSNEKPLNSGSHSLCHSQTKSSHSHHILLTLVLLQVRR